MNKGPGIDDQEARQRGVLAALAAYLFWGFSPIYFKFIQSVPALEVIAHRILWSIPLLAGFLLLRDGRMFWQKVRLPARTVLTLLLSSILLAANWLIFVWAVGHDQILSTSLGYFTGPLVNFLLGFLFLKERMTRIQVIGVAIAAAGTVYLALYIGQPPWIALGLAFSFGVYGLIRKKLHVGPMVGLLWEAVLLLVPAAIFIAWRADHGLLAFGKGDLSLDILLALTGLVTILPLIWFNVAARSMSLTTLGFFQYIAPSLSFLIAVLLYREPFTLGYGVAFGCIWFATIMVTTESVVRVRRTRKRAK